MRRISLISAVCLFSLTLLAQAADPAAKPAVGDPVEDIGTFIEVGNGLSLQLILKDHRLLAKFVDAAKTLVENPAESILFIVDDPGHSEDKWRTVLKPDGEVDLTSPLLFHGIPDLRAKIIVRYADGNVSTFPRTPLELKRNL